MNNNSYVQFICKYSADFGYSDIERLLSNVELSSNVIIQNLSDMEEEILLATLNAIIIAERLREYDGKEFYFNLEKLPGERYLGILSVYEGSPLAKEPAKLLKDFFLEDKWVNARLIRGGEDNRIKANSYWKEQAARFPQQIWGNMFYQPSHMYKDRFPLGEDIRKTLLYLHGSNRKGLKATVSAVWGRIISQYRETADVLLEEFHEGGELTSVPILYNANAPKTETIKSLQEQFARAEEFDGISNERLSEIAGKSLCNIALSEYFVDDSKYSFFLKSMKNQTVYRLAALPDSISSIKVIYHLRGSVPSIEYVYDHEVFEDVDMEDLHKVFCEMLQNYLLGRCECEVSLKAIQEANSNERRRLDAKMKVLSLVPAFSALSEEELRELTDHALVFHGNNQQDFVTVGGRINYMYIAVSGKLQVSGLDRKKLLHPLLVLREGELFGMECIYDDEPAVTGLKVLGQEAIVLGIEKDFLKKLVRFNPDMLLDFVRIQSERLHKFQKLWMTT